MLSYNQIAEKIRIKYIRNTSTSTSTRMPFSIQSCRSCYARLAEATTLDRECQNAATINTLIILPLFWMRMQKHSLAHAHPKISPGSP
jgi:ribosomal protein L40E